MRLRSASVPDQIERNGEQTFAAIGESSAATASTTVCSSRDLGSFSVAWS
jgi:hypothetical protein